MRITLQEMKKRTQDYDNFGELKLNSYSIGLHVLYNKYGLNVENFEKIYNAYLKYDRFNLAYTIFYKK
jgi:hypothetical protein